MSMFDRMIRGGGEDYPSQISKSSGSMMKPRTFKENIDDQILFHRNRLKELEEVKESLTPDIEKFVEAMQKLG